MPFWANKSQALVSPSTWTETVAMTTEKMCVHPHIVQSAHSAVVDDSLPLPAQACVNPVSGRRGRWGPRTPILAASWAKFKRRLVPETAQYASAPSFIEGTLADSAFSRVDGPPQGDGEDEEVDEIVVDRTWSEDLKSSATRSTTHSDLGTSPEISGETGHAPSVRDRESLASRGDWAIRSPLVFLRWRLWPIFVELFCPKFENEKSEQDYAQVCRFFVGECPRHPYICF